VPDVVEQLEEFFASEARSGVQAAYLFGSVAEGRAHRESDVDVGVLLDRNVYPDRRDRFEARLHLISGLVDVLDSNEVDVVVLNDAPPQLGRHIVTTGTRIHCREAKADHAFVRDIQLRAADLTPFVERMRRIKLGGRGSERSRAHRALHEGGHRTDREGRGSRVSKPQMPGG